MKRLTRLFPPLIAFAAGAAAMLLFLQPAHADPLVTVTPTGLDLSWQAWLLLGAAAAGGTLKVLDVVIAGLKWLAPRTQTTLDDTARDDLQIVRDDIAAVLKVVGGLVPAAGVPTTASDKPALTLAPPPRDSQAGMVGGNMLSGLGILAGIILIAGAVLGWACSATQARQTATSAEHAVINCTAQELGTTPALDLATLVAVANVVAAERVKCTPAGGSLDWKCVETDLIAEGKVLGGCSFVALVTGAGAATPPAAVALASPTPGALPGRAELEDFRARMAGGATFHVATGDL